MFINDDGLHFLKKWEGCKLTAYKDVAGIWTIGYGTIRYHNGVAVKKGDKISQEQADSELMYECDGIATKLINIIKVRVTQSQMNAIVSFCYNVGVHGFMTSTLLRKLNTRSEIIQKYFTMWNKAHVDGKLVAVPGLTNRRKAEFALFCGE